MEIGSSKAGLASRKKMERIDKLRKISQLAFVLSMQRTTGQCANTKKGGFWPPGSNTCIKAKYIK